MKKFRKNKKGFTLIEVIVVLVIIGILLAIAVPSIMGYVDQANEAKYIATARNGYVAAQTINAKNNAKGAAVTSPAKFSQAAIQKELGLPTTDTSIGAASCVLADKQITSCNVEVDGLAAGKVVHFTTGKDGEATVITGTVEK